MKWLTITEYSTLKNISVSTIRRYIRSRKVNWKKEDGKYLIEVSDNDLISSHPQGDSLTIGLMKEEIKQLKSKLKIVQEENNELKMLVQLYEARKIEDEIPQIPFS